MHYPNGAEEKREVWSAAILQPEGTGLRSCHYQVSPPPRACWEPVCCFDRCLRWLIYQQITEFISTGRQIPEFNRIAEQQAPPDPLRSRYVLVGRARRRDGLRNA